MTKLSDRINNLPESATLAMARLAREMTQKGIEVINLSLGEPDFKTPVHIRQGAIKAIQSGKYFAYPPVNGYLDLRQEISKKFKDDNGLDYTVDQIVVSNGAKQSISNVFMTLLNPGDEVIVYTPYWVSYTAMISLAGGIPKFIKGGIEDDFKATSNQLKEAITDKTRAVIFSSPCNPTGSVFKEDELKAMAEVLANYQDIVVIADEIYELINFSGKHTSIGTLDRMQDRTVTVNGMSKGFAMTGWRVGYIGAPLWLAKAASKVQGQYTSGNCTIAQRAAYTALTSPKKSSYEMVRAYHDRRELVHQLLSGIPEWEVNMPDGAFYFFPDVSAYLGKSYARGTIATVKDLCMFLLQDARVSLVTGEAFGDDRCLRVSYTASEKKLQEAVRRIKVSLEKLS